MAPSDFKCLYCSCTKALYKSTRFSSSPIQTTRRKRSCVRFSDHPSMSFTPSSTSHSQIPSFLDDHPVPASNALGGKSNKSNPVHNVINDTTMTPLFSTSEPSSSSTTDTAPSLGTSSAGSCLPSSLKSSDSSSVFLRLLS